MSERIHKIISSVTGAFNRENNKSKQEESDVKYHSLPEEEKDVEDTAEEREDSEKTVVDPDLFDEEARLCREETLDQIQHNEGHTSSLQAAWNISNLVQGTGTLGLPFAVSQGGYMSLVAMVIIGIVTNYTGKLIIECVYDKTDSNDPDKRGVRVRKSYGQIGKACWKYGEEVVSCVQLLHLLCACILYLMLVADFFDEIFYTESMPLTAWTVIAGVLLLPLVFLNKIVVVSWLSMFSVFVMFTVFFMMIGYGIAHEMQWRFTALPFINFKGFPISWCIMLFSYVCHPYLPNIEESMKEPRNFNKVMDGSFLMATTFKAVFGYICVLTFWSSGIQQEVSENLPHGWFKTIMETLLGLNGLLSFALPAFTFIKIIHKCNVSFLPPCFSDENRQLSWREIIINMFLRTLLVSVSIFIAAAIPQFSLMMAVIGSITAVCLTLVFPCTFHAILNRDTLSKTELGTDLVIIVVGILSGLFGLVFSVQAMILYDAEQKQYQ